jgi:hypothetical protein
MIPRSLLCALLASAASGAMAAESAPGSAALAVLGKSWPAVVWNAQSVVAADIRCTGGRDHLALGRGKDGQAWVGLVARGARPMALRFPVGTEAQNAFCTAPVRIVVTPQTCRDAAGDKLAGCRPVRGCAVFAVEDDSCDAIRFYWDATSKTLRWWRT